MTAGYYNGANDARELVRLLHLAGYEVNAVLGCGETAEELQHLPAAALNIVVHKELGIAPAEMLSERSGTPFVVRCRLTAGRARGIGSKRLQALCPRRTKRRYRKNFRVWKRKIFCA